MTGYVDLQPLLPALRGRRVHVVAAALAELRGEPSLAGLPVVGFFSHVEAQRGREAAAAGCTTVLPRSAFVQKLDALLAEAASGTGGGEPGAGA